MTGNGNPQETALERADRLVAAKVAAREQEQPMVVVRGEPRADLRAFEATSIDEALRLATILVRSGLMPSHVKTPEAAFAILAAGRELGLTALQSMRSLYFVEGKVTLSADLMVALAKKHPDCEYFRVVEATSDGCTCTTKRRGEEPTTMTWTIEDGKRAGLLGKKNWAAYPKAMLRARVSAELCRAVYPDALMGAYDPDEIDPPRAKPAPHRAAIDLAPSQTSGKGDPEVASPPPSAVASTSGGGEGPATPAHIHIGEPGQFERPAREGRGPTPAHDPQTGEVASSPGPVDDNARSADDEADRYFEAARGYIERLQELADDMRSTDKDLLDVGKALKASGLPEPFLKPVREKYVHTKKRLAARARAGT